MNSFYGDGPLYKSLTEDSSSENLDDDSNESDSLKRKNTINRFRRTSIRY